MWKILLLVVCPLLIPFTGTYAYKKSPKCGATWFYHFYNLPIVKIVTWTICCIFNEGSGKITGMRGKKKEHQRKGKEKAVEKNNRLMDLGIRFDD
jgi:hypothetical protein